MSEPETTMQPGGTDVVRVRRGPRGGALAPTPPQMLQAAIERGIEPDQLRQLMDLNDRWEATNARKAFTAAMALFKANPPTIIKDKRVGYENRDGTFTGYTHATLAEVANKIAAGLGAVGISHSWDVKHADGMVIVSCTLTHEGGHSETVTMPPAAPDDSGKKNKIQQVASAITYMQRYSLLSITGLAAKDQDDDGRSTGDGEPETIGPGQLQELKDLIKLHNVDLARFLAYIKAPALEAIPATSFEAVKADLLSKRQRGPQASAAAAKLTPAQLEHLRAQCDKFGIGEREVCKHFRVDVLEELTFQQLQPAITWLATVN